jgi:hypothetical protein
MLGFDENYFEAESFAVFWCVVWQYRGWLVRPNLTARWCEI